MNDAINLQNTSQKQNTLQRAITLKNRTQYTYKNRTYNRVITLKKKRHNTFTKYITRTKHTTDL
jgi:ribosomal protein S10